MKVIVGPSEGPGRRARYTPDPDAPLSVDEDAIVVTFTRPGALTSQHSQVVRLYVTHGQLDDLAGRVRAAAALLAEGRRLLACTPTSSPRYSEIRAELSRLLAGPYANENSGESANAHAPANAVTPTEECKS